MWTLRSRIIWHRSQKRRILCGRSATTSRGVLEAYSSQKPQSATVRLSMWKGAPNNAEGKAKQCIGVMMSFCSILLRFLNRTFQNAEIRCSVWKQTEAHWSIAAAKRMNWKWSSVRSDCEFGDMKGVLVRPQSFKWVTNHTGSHCLYTRIMPWSHAPLRKAASYEQRKTNLGSSP